MSKRFDFVDIAKGLGIMLVIMGHIEHDFVPFCGSVHIPLFFVLSGYLYNIDKTEHAPFGENVFKRVKRLIIPYFIYNMLLYAKYILKHLVSNTLTLKVGGEAFAGFCYSAALLYKGVPAEKNFEGFVFGNGPLWFLTAMAVASIIFYAIIYFVLKHKFDLKKILVACMVLGVTSWLLCRYLPIYLPWSAEMALVGTIFMFFGLCLRKYNAVERFGKKWAVPIVCVIVFAVLHYINGSANMAIQDYGRSLSLYVLLGILGSVIMLYLSLLVDKSRILNRAVSYVGQNTLIILALHMTIISIMVSVLEKINLNMLVEWGGFWTIRFVVGLFGCIIINEFLTKVCKVPKHFL